MSKKYKIKGVVYRTEKMKDNKDGIEILDVRNNTFIVLDKNLKVVKGPFASIVDCTYSMFNIPIEL